MPKARLGHVCGVAGAATAPVTAATGGGDPMRPALQKAEQGSIGTVAVLIVFVVCCGTAKASIKITSNGAVKGSKVRSKTTPIIAHLSLQGSHPTQIV